MFVLSFITIYYRFNFWRLPLSEFLPFETSNKYTSQKEAFLKTKKNAYESMMEEKFLFGAGGDQLSVLR